MARDLSERLYMNLMLDLPVDSPAMAADFGIRSPAHYSALQAAVREGVSVTELDEALGNGPALTEIARRADEKAPMFETPYDCLREEDAGEEDEP